ncbi:MAG: alpha/beta hydrolase [Hyphomicrobiaceae bacterium]|nr:alpha/beta hydrolase [Hyphomicrobiaceae bacterium]
MRKIAPLHPDAKRIIEILAGLDGGAPPPSTVDGMREFARKRARRLRSAPEEVARVDDRTVASGSCAVPVRIYYPPGAGSQPLPAYVYAHGGGFVVGDLDMVDSLCRTVCRDAGIVVVSVDYRLAPEHPFPAGLDDTIAVARWVAAEGPAIGIDPSRLAIGGDSAGGNLAAATSLALAAGGDVKFRFQVLVYPVTDLTCSEASYKDLGTGYPLTADRMRVYIKYYLRNPEEARDPRASPLLARSLAGQPPALVVLAGLDPLVDEGAAYARRLREAGIEVEVHEVPDFPHGFLGWTGEAQAARDSVALIGRRLKARLHA